MPTPASPELRVPVDGSRGQTPIGPTQLPAPNTAEVMGLPFHTINESDLVRLFREGVRSGRGGWIVTPNLEVLRRFTSDSESRELILSASHRVADGAPIVWASRLAGAPVPERVPGSDLVLSLPEAAAKAGARAFLLGGNPGVATAAARRLEDLHPELGRVGSYCPPVGFEDDPAELARINAAIRETSPVLILIGLGFPKQERLIRLLRSELPERLVRGSWDLAQLPRRGPAARPRRPAAPRSRVAPPSLA